MIIHQISRSLSSYNPPKDKFISEEELISALKMIEGFHFEKKLFKSPVSERLLLIGYYSQNSLKQFKFTYIDGKIRITYDSKLNDQIIIGYDKLSNFLNAYVFCDIDTELPKNFIEKAYLRVSITK